MSLKEEVIRAFYAARMRDDHEALRPLVTEDVVFHEPAPRATRATTQSPTPSSTISIGCSSRRREHSRSSRPA
jgi:ketosteroid isomerase-like protein